VPIEVGAGSAIYDSAYREVGGWRIIGTPADLEEPITPDGAAE